MPNIMVMILYIGQTLIKTQTLPSYGLALRFSQAHLRGGLERIWDSVP